MAPWGATDNLYEGSLTQATGYGESKVEGLSRGSDSAWSADSADGLKKMLLESWRLKLTEMEV